MQIIILRQELKKYVLNVPLLEDPPRWQGVTGKNYKDYKIETIRIRMIRAKIILRA